MLYLGYKLGIANWKLSIKNPSQKTKKLFKKNQRGIERIIFDLHKKQSKTKDSMKVKIGFRFYTCHIRFFLWFCFCQAVQECCVKESLSQNQDHYNLNLVKVKSNLWVSI